MRKFINNKASQATPARKAVCLLTAAALVATMGFGTALAAGGSGDGAALEVSDKATQAEEEDAVQSPATSEQAEAVASTTDEAAVSASSAAEKPQRRGVSQLSDAQVGSIVWIKSGSTVYKSTSDSKGRSVILSYKIQVTNIETVGDTTWYKFDFVDLGNVFLPGYHYVKVQDTSATEPSDSSSADISASCGPNVSLALSGAPNGSQAEVKTLAPRDYSSEAFDEIGSHKVAFAVDISIKDVNGQEWQPNDGEGVAVSLDADKLGLKNGEKIGILHEHDGQLTNLGVYAVAGGKLTFETDGFSNFYGYTVDFEYDGTWHSIGGGSDIYLSELFAALGIEKSPDDVTSVAASDPDLLSVGQVIADGYTGETTWMVHSVKAFDTEELLTISFKDGSVLKINVYDANYISLSDDMSIGNGEVIGACSVTSNETIKLDGKATVKGTISVTNGAILTIEGKGTLERDASFTDKMFYVADGGKLVIKGSSEGSEGSEGNIVIDGGATWEIKDVSNSTRKTLTVTKGEKTTSAAIYVGYAGGKSANKAATKGTVELENVTMQNLYSGSASGSQAPAIHVTGDSGDEVDGLHSTVVMNCVTVKNCATLSGQSITLFNDCDATLTNCTYKDNYSGGTYAGAIKAGGPGYFSQLTMKGCTATGNYSAGWGGVVLWAANNKCGNEESKATIDTCDLSKNTARWLGGALSNEAVMEVKGTTIKGNIAMAGGGIATFPFTLTKDGDGGDNACGLTLGVNNEIEGNIAYASDDFTPYSKQDKEGVDGDDVKPIANKITYTGGGGGVWCYMNKDKWTCSLKIGNGNEILSNVSNNVGGGVYVDKVAGLTTTLSITGATIKENKAVNGGGIAVKDAEVEVSSGKVDSNNASGNGGGIYVASGASSASPTGKVTVLGEGSVSKNIAKNGGGIYVDFGVVEAKGGFVTYNTATGTYDGSTTKVDGSSSGLQGVGGGVFLKKGSFSLEGSNIGIYSNVASVAANDVYASGTETTLEVPDVKTMDLSGISGTKPTGWYADYMKTDLKYPEDVIGKGNPGRYAANAEGNVEVGYEDVLSKSKNRGAFYCLTLGIPHPGYGDLTITKKLLDGSEKPCEAIEDQTFVFEVTGKTAKDQDYSLTVALVVPAGKSCASVTVPHVPDGTYIVSEKSDWSWRYEQVGQVCYEPLKDSNDVADGDSSADNGLTYGAITVGALSPNWTAAVTNKLTNDKWLSGDCYCENWWKGLQEIAHAGGPEPIVSAGEGESSAVSEN